MSRLVIATVLLIGGCGRAEVAPDAARVDPPPADAIAVRMGGREVRVHCRLECDALEAELSTLHARCVGDPSSTPHHVTTDAAHVSLGCCVETRAAYERACGLEGPMGACESAWGARCERGERAEEHRAP